MDQTFYRHVQHLYEEFEKKELHSLSLERKLSEKMMYQSESNLNLQEYLLSINQRQKAAEESYRTIMKQMDELDKRTDLMCLKLEKLNVLRDTAMLPTSNWSHPQKITASYPQSFCNTKDLNLISDLTFSKKGCESVSVQTDAQFLCEKRDSGPSVSNLYASEINVVSDDYFKPPALQVIPDDVQANSHTCISNIKENLEELEFVPSPENIQYNTEPLTAVSRNQENSTEVKHTVLSETFVSNVNFKTAMNNEATESVTSEKNIPPPNLLPIDAENSVQSNPEFSKNIKNKAEVQIRISDSEYRNNFENVDAAEAVESVVSKSDVESLNNEFHFLETDNRKRNASKRQDRRNAHLNQIAFMNSEKLAQKGKESNMEPSKSVSATKHSPLNQLVDDKSDSSISGTDPNSPLLHSENASIASDSDGLYGKIPLTESAAYKALLGQTASTNQTAKPDSDSEDEVEKVFAHSVKKNEKKSENSQKKAEKSISKPVEPLKLPSKATNPSSSKPQSKQHSKLSKDTRRALGLDISSESEADQPVKPTVSKDDDSDFDFFD